MNSESAVLDQQSRRMLNHCRLQRCGLRRTRRPLLLESLEERVVLAAIVAVGGSGEGSGTFTNPFDGDLWEGSVAITSGEWVTKNFAQEPLPWIPLAYGPAVTLALAPPEPSTVVDFQDRIWDVRFGMLAAASAFDMSSSALATVRGDFEIVPGIGEKEGDPVLVSVAVGEYKSAGATDTKVSISGAVSGPGDFHLKIGDRISVTTEARASASYSSDVEFGPVFAHAQVTLLIDPVLGEVQMIESVAAQWDDEGDRSASDKTFGEYLRDVPLENPFTVTVKDPENVVVRVTYEIEGQGERSADRIIPTLRQWQFDPEVWKLPAGVSDITIRAYADNSQEPLAKYEGKIKVRTNLPLEIQATYPGSPGNVDIDTLRLIEDIPLEVMYTATLNDLPLVAAYKDKLDIVARQADGSGQNTAVGIESFEPLANQTRGGRATFTHEFANIVNGDDRDYSLFAVPKEDIEEDISNSEPLLVISLPAWMGTPSTSYSTGPEVGEVFGEGSGAYVIKVAFPKDLEFKLPPTSDTPFGLFDGLETKASTGLSLTVFAKPTYGPTDVKMMAKDWFATATVLGQPLLNDKEGKLTSGILVDAQLTPKTLDGSGFRVTTNPIPLVKPNQLAFARNFGTNLPWVVPIPASPLAGTFDFTGSFEGALDELTVTASVQFDVSSGSPVLVRDGTFLQLDVKAGAKLSGEISAAVTILGYTVAEARVSGELFADFDASLIMDYEGSAIDFDPDQIGFNKSTAILTVGYDVKYNIEVFGYDVLDEDPGPVSHVTSLLAVSPQALENAIAQPGVESLTVYAADTEQAKTAFDFVKAMAPRDTDHPLEIDVLLKKGIYGGQTLGAPENVLLNVNGREVEVIGSSPALTVISGTVVVSGLTFTNATDAATILVTGGSLALRDSIVHETSGGSQAAIAVAGGSVDLGSAEDPGGNTLHTHGPGTFFNIVGDGIVTAAGNVSHLDGVAIVLTPAPDTVNEGALVELTTTVSSLPAGGPFEYAWGVLKNGASFAMGSDPSFLLTPDDDGPYEITLIVTESDVEIARATHSIVATNLAPVASNNAYSTVQSTAVVGNVITDDAGGGADSDPAGAQDPLTISTFTTPTNGALALNSDGSFTYTPNSGFAGIDSFDYTISDGDGGFATATVTINVAALPPSTTGGAEVINGVLKVVGTQDADRVIITRLFNDIVVAATFLPNDFRRFPVDSIVRIHARMLGGNDLFVVAGNVEVPAILDGGEGNDNLIGGRGLSLLLGGDGDDLLDGGGGRSILVGGRGKDRLVGGQADDILIGGSAQLVADPGADDYDEAALVAVLSAWSSSNSYSSRVDSIAALLSDLDDGDEDHLIGGSGRDLFFGGLNDRLLDVRRSGTNKEAVL